MKDRRFGCLTVIGLFVLLWIGGQAILKHGYCRSWWGKGSLVMRSLWLCDCSREFEQALYPASTEVLYSACEVNKPIQIREEVGLVVGRDVLTPGVISFPGGDWVSLEPDRDNVQLLNLYTDQSITFAGDLKAWLADDLAWIQYPEKGMFLFRPSLQAEIPLFQLQKARPELNEGQDFTPALLEVLKAAEAVFVVDISPYGKTIVVLVPDYWQHPDQNFFIIVGDRFRDIPISEDDKIYTLLSKRGIPYQVGFSWLSTPVEKTSLLSPKRRFVAKGDGVYNNMTMEKVIDYSMPSLVSQLSTTSGYPIYNDFRPCCWRSDEKVLILSISNSPYTTLRSFWLTPPDIGAFGLSFDVPLPVLKVTLPDELFDSAPTP